MRRNSIILTLIMFVSFIYATVQAPKDNRQIDLMSRYRTALYLEKMGQIDRAIKIYSYLHNQAPENFIFFKKYFDLLIQLKDYDKAQNVILNQINRYPENRELQIELGKLLALKGDTITAIETFNKFLDSQGYSRYSVSRIFNLLVSIGMYDLAEDIVSKVRNKLNDRAFFSFELASYYKMRKLYEKALIEYLELIKNKPENKQMVEKYISMLPVDKENISSLIRILISYQPFVGEDTINSIRLELYFSAGFYDSCFSIVKYLDKNEGDKGQKILELADRLYKSRHYNWSKKIYTYLVNNEKYSFLYLPALTGLANSYYQLLISSDNFNVLNYFYNENRFFSIDLIYGYNDSVGTRNLDIARSLYESIIGRVKSIRDKAETIYRIGILEYRVMKNFDSALHFFRQAFDYAQDLELKAKILDDIVDVNLSKGDIKAAGEECHKGCKLFEGTDYELLMKMKLVQIWFLEGKVDSCYRLKNDLIALASGENENLNDIVEFYQFLNTYFINRDKNKNSAKVRFIEAEKLLRMDKLSESIALLESIITDFPKEKISLVARFRLAQEYLILGDEEKAIDVTSELVKNTGLLAQLSALMMGDYFYARKDYEKSKRWYLFFINNYPMSVFIEQVRDKYRNIEKIS